MAAKTQRHKTESKRVDAEKTRSRRDEKWDERLRLVGDARFVDVEWSGRDQPYWPLPKGQVD